jgi:hypothetical protein
LHYTVAHPSAPHASRWLTQNRDIKVERATEQTACRSIWQHAPMNAHESAPAESEGTLMHVDQDLELDFIREFATGGELLVGLGVDRRRERIRVAIYTHKLAHMPFRDGPMTYAEAYAECFGLPLEMRRTVRQEPKSERSTAIPLVKI